MAIVTNPRGTDMNFILSTTQDHFYKSGAMHDAIFNSNKVLKALRRNGRVKTVTGGYQIQVNLMYGSNTTVDSVQPYQVLDVAPQDGITSCFVPWAQYVVSNTIDDLTEVRNRGAAALVSVAAEKNEQATMSLSERLNQDMMAIEGITTATTGNSGLNLISVPMWVQKTPGSLSIDVGGIDESAQSWWQNQSLTFGTTDTTLAFEQQMRRIYNLSSKGTGGEPDLIVCDMYTFEHYQQSMHELKRYVGENGNVTADFGGYRYLNAEVVWDIAVPDWNAVKDYDSASWADGTMFCLNTKFLQLVMQAGRDFKWTKWQSPVDQLVRTTHCLFYGNLVCSNRRKQGVLYDIEDGVFTS